MNRLSLSPFLRDLLITGMTSVVSSVCLVVMMRWLATGLGPEGAYMRWQSALWRGHIGVNALIWKIPRQPVVWAIRCLLWNLFGDW